MTIESVSYSNSHQHCALSDACFGSTKQGTADFTQKSHRVYHRGESLFSMGDPFDALYIVRAGSAKSFLSSSRGDEQISGFFHPGDMIGADGFDTMTHTHSLKFLETSSVCRIGLGELNKALGESALMRQQLLKSMSRALVDEQQLLLSVGKLNSEQRLAKFLLDLSARFEQRGLSAKVFDLSMTRIDIANFLGMAIETISRLLGKMQQQGMINVNRRQISLLNMDKLRHCLSDDDEKEWAVPLELKARQTVIAKPHLAA
ncbi:MAG: CRP/FNR family transcriptional regulator [Paraglaciecola sp.]|jgi:CRP/FNR family transcriptional regulator